MAYIYKITNLSSQKSYIGKTEFNPERRFQEHIRDKNRFPDRPLYRAINKYGIENFSFEVLEKTDIPEEREIYYIQFYNSYGSTGYNATLGGDGKKLLDYDKIIKSYARLQNVQEVAIECDCDSSQIRKILKENNILTLKSGEPTKNKYGKKIGMFDLKENWIRNFDSLRDAAYFLTIKRDLNLQNMQGIASHLSEVCRGKRKSCQGYKWKFLEFIIEDNIPE